MAIADSAADRITPAAENADIRASEGESGAWSALFSDDPVAFGNGWLGIVARSFPSLTQGTLFLARAGRSEMEPLAVWSAPGHPLDLARLKERGTEALTAATVQRTAVLAGAGELAYAALPIVVHDSVAAMALVEARLDGPLAGRRLIRHLQWSAAWIEAFLRRHHGVESQSGVEQAALVVEAIEAVASAARFDDAARAFCGLIADRFACGRVALGVRRKLGSELVTLSQSADFEGRTEAARAFEAAMDEALDQETVLAAPVYAGGTRLVAYAQEALRNALHVESVLTIPIYAAHQPFGALVLARSGAGFTQGDVDLLDALAASAGGNAGRAP